MLRMLQAEVEDAAAPNVKQASLGFLVVLTSFLNILCCALAMYCYVYVRTHSDT